jgi:hypothetical protein
MLKKESKKRTKNSEICNTLHVEIKGEKKDTYSEAVSFAYNLAYEVKNILNNNKNIDLVYISNIDIYSNRPSFTIRVKKYSLFLTNDESQKELNLLIEEIINFCVTKNLIVYNSGISFEWI